MLYVIAALFLLYVLTRDSVTNLLNRTVYGIVDSANEKIKRDLENDPEMKKRWMISENRVMSLETVW